LLQDRDSGRRPVGGRAALNGVEGCVKTSSVAEKFRSLISLRSIKTLRERRRMIIKSIPASPEYKD
jgi:hypothetical protein